MADRSFDSPAQPTHAPPLPDSDTSARWATAGRHADHAPSPPATASPTRAPRTRPRRRLPAEVLTDEEVRALMAVCDPDTVIGLRHRALLAILYRAGLRISEALQLRPKDVDAGSGTIRVLFGKRGYARTVGVDPGASRSAPDPASTRPSAPLAAAGPTLPPAALAALVRVSVPAGNALRDAADVVRIGARRGAGLPFAGRPDAPPTPRAVHRAAADNAAAPLPRPPTAPRT